jgi:chemotaxis protein histidine kinase CheA
MNSIDLSSYKDLYIETAKEYIGKLHTAIQRLKKDANDKDAIDIAHLCSHSLKSQSLMMGYHKTGELAHMLEQCFAGIQQKTIVLNYELLSTVQKACDELLNSVNYIEQSNSEIEIHQTQALSSQTNIPISV